MLNLPGSRPRNGRGGLKTLVVGAGEAGRTLARALRRSPSSGLVPLRFLDHAPGRRPRAALAALRRLSPPPATTGEPARARRAPAGGVPPPSRRPRRVAQIAETARA